MSWGMRVSERRSPTILCTYPLSDVLDRLMSI